jgi:TrmH family RNA methyltransferase
VDAVIAADAATDPYNPNVARASQGALFTVPLAVASPADAVAWLAASSVAILPAGPEEGVAPWEHDLTGAVAIVIGSEHAGLSSAWKALPRITLPMAGTSDSLNASTAAAIVLYEAVRQRTG